MYLAGDEHGDSNQGIQFCVYIYIYIHIHIHVYVKCLLTGISHVLTEEALDVDKTARGSTHCMDFLGCSQPRGLGMFQSVSVSNGSRGSLRHLSTHSCGGRG